MQFVYMFAGMAYQQSYSYEKNASINDASRFYDAEQKVAFIILGFVLGKFLFSFTFDKLLTPYPYKSKAMVTGGVCVFALFVQLLVSSLSYHSYNTGWFFSAFFFGIQDAVLSGKLEFNSFNEVVEGDETNMDIYVLAKILGGLIAFFTGLAFRRRLPLYHLIFLIATFIFCAVSTFMKLNDTLKSLAESDDDSKLKINTGDNCKSKYK